ncbi:hypothetical protein [Luteibacter sp. 329MFSha]|uniref:hypothetical protein n=1 Tax=Luteibacter sp. 329MFSha TaxID=1798239 RepID=UPI0008C1B1F8|nr:hypothetical protein [Luteibacter sp. 329MFSha]SEV96492.1 hypothetical protein SAMN04515660_1355 [Luteibacter sp. 329MFSha]
MPDEDVILQHAEIILEAVALSESMLDRDILEARFRARRVHSLAVAAGFPDVAHAALHVVDRLGDIAELPAHGCGEAIEALSIAIDRAQELR